MSRRQLAAPRLLSMAVVMDLQVATLHKAPTMTGTAVVGTVTRVATAFPQGPAPPSHSQTLNSSPPPQVSKAW